MEIPIADKFNPRGTFASQFTDEAQHSDGESFEQGDRLQRSATGKMSFSSAVPTGQQSVHIWSIAKRRSNRNAKAASSTKRSRLGREARVGVAPAASRPAFKSTRLKEPIYKPWMEQKDPAMRWARWITLLSIFIGFAVAGVSV
jgi:hypothetical protein